MKPLPSDDQALRHIRMLVEAAAWYHLASTSPRHASSQTEHDARGALLEAAHLVGASCVEIARDPSRPKTH